MSANFYAWLPELALDPKAKSFQDDVEALYEQSEPPHPTLTAFVAALLERYPDPDDDDTDTVWADGPIQDEILGRFINVAVIWPRADETWAVFLKSGHACGLVCYDPQSDRVYPP
ncbi:hypothetical protein [Terricaulis silvestris]|uniref:Uncharacterized protein n=1 Tax=Terricaulis silvestris TaxID=2686094 RepID=A0A6I6MJL1_9CAUL|nr:hypothetical protein [Terricaulis silvestris]QGZ95360.1 hypothetical protein DSM104635_02209 [Terricaulis silvestris]